MAAFQAQISYLLAKVNLGASVLTVTPLASSSVAGATLVKPDAVRPVTSSGAPRGAMVRSPGRLEHSSVEALASTVKYQPAGAESDGEGAPCGEYLSSSGPELVHARSGPMSMVTQAPPSTKVDSACKDRTTSVVRIRSLCGSAPRCLELLTAVQRLRCPPLP